MGPRRRVCNRVASSPAATAQPQRPQSGVCCPHYCHSIVNYATVPLAGLYSLETQRRRHVRSGAGRSAPAASCAVRFATISHLQHKLPAAGATGPSAWRPSPCTAPLSLQLGAGIKSQPLTFKAKVSHGLATPCVIVGCTEKTARGRSCCSLLLLCLTETIHFQELVNLQTPRSSAC